MRMSDEVLEHYVKKYIEAYPLKTVPFIFQGGEPTLCGLHFFEKVVALQEKYKGNKTVTNSMQTNGLLLNDDFAAFLKQHDFLVGISIDGPQALHDINRVTKGGQPTYTKVIAGLNKLKDLGVRFNTLTVVSAANAPYGKEVYLHLKELGSTFMQFIPLTGVTQQVSSKDYGSFLINIFDEWIKEDLGKINVQFIDEFVSAATYNRANLCIFRPECGDQLIVEQNGDIYSCDHFVFEKYKIGNIVTDDLLTVINGMEQVKFSIQKSNVPKECYSCKYLNVCYGGCPAHRQKDENGDEHNILCTGYKMIFSHMEQNLFQAQEQ